MFTPPALCDSEMVRETVSVFVWHDATHKLLRLLCSNRIRAHCNLQPGRQPGKLRHCAAQPIEHFTLPVRANSAPHALNLVGAFLSYSFRCCIHEVYFGHQEHRSREATKLTRFVGCAGIEHIVKGALEKNSAQCASECAFYSHSRARQQSLGVALSRLNRRSTVPSGFCFESVGKSKLCGKPAWVRVRRGRGPKPIGQKFGVIAKGRSSGIENAVR